MWQMDEFLKLLRLMVEKGASDLHVRVPNPPVLRIDGRLTPLENMPAITAKDAELLLEHIATPEQKECFRNELELDFAYSVPELARFRVNVLRQRGTISFALRLIPPEIPTIDSLGLPPVLQEVILKPRGLVLVTGPTGSGKTTTMAAMIDYLNDNEARNVITIEDPIEFIYENKRCLIAQRDLGDDTKSFDKALIHALRHDPDVIIVGEMRDLATIATAIRAAETGHLVLGTLHTIDAPQTIDRIIDIFPADQQQQIRLQLAQVLVAVFSQTLLPRAGGGQIAAVEILLASSAVRNLIREGKTFGLYNAIQIGAKDEMRTLDQALVSLVKDGHVTQEDALLKASNPDQFKDLLGFRSAGVPSSSFSGVNIGIIDE
jgi:twitching motility protein PilT